MDERKLVQILQETLTTTDFQRMWNKRKIILIGYENRSLQLQLDENNKLIVQGTTSENQYFKRTVRLWKVKIKK